MSRPMREDEKVLIQSFVERGYDTFITRCADGRDMSKGSNQRNRTRTRLDRRTSKKNVDWLTNSEV